MIKAIYLPGGDKATVEKDAGNIRRIVEQRPGIVWIDILVENDEFTPDELSLLSGTLKLHELSVEDCLIPQYHPKVEEFEEYVFVAVHGIKSRVVDLDNFEDSVYEVDLVILRDCVVTVHSGNIPILDSIFEKSRIKPLVEMKSMGILLYNIFLNILTSYENYLESINDSIDRIEDKILENPSKELMSEIFFLKKVLLFMRKLAEPLKNVYAYFVRENPTIIMKKSIVYFRDIFFQYDRMMQSISSYNQIVSNIMEVYVSGLTLKLDEIIKFLTIIATIFMPAVIITSYYGMNVAFPEHRILGVNSVWFFAFAVIAVSTAGVYLYIKRKKWF